MNYALDGDDVCIAYMYTPDAAESTCHSMCICNASRYINAYRSTPHIHYMHDVFSSRVISR